MSTNLKLDKENKLSWEIYSDTIKLEDIISFKKDHFQQKLHFEIEFIILDFRDAQVQMTKDEVRTLLTFTKGFKRQFAGSKMAILINAPKQAVFSHFFTEVNREINHGLITEIFSTERAALSWFEINGLTSLDHLR